MNHGLYIRLSALAAALVLGACSSTNVSSPPTPAPIPASPVTVQNSGTLLGVAVHAINNEGVQGKLFAALSGTSVNSVRDDAGWKYVETTKGSLQIPPAWDKFVDEANGKSIKPILILDYGNKFYDGGDKPRSADAIAAYVRYATFVVNHFKGRVKYYELWNEWDVTTGGTPPGSPADYAALFNAAFPAIKQADPNANVVACAGLHGVKAFYDEIAKLGVVSKADGIAIHPYNSEKDFGPETSVNYVMELEQSMVSLTGHSSVNIYVTEIGWPSATGIYAEGQVELYATRTTLLLAALPYVKGVWWYDIKNDGQDASNKEDNYGLLNFDWSPKPAWAAFADAVSFAHSHQLSLSTQANLKQRKAVIDVKNQDGSKATILWNLDSTKPALYSRCGAGQEAETSAQPGGGSALVSNPTLVGVSHGSCAIRPLAPGRLMSQ